MGIYVFILFLSFITSVLSHKIKLTSNAPVVVGATVSFKAVLTDDYGKSPSGNYQFKWRDNGIPSHKYTVDGDFTTSYWNVTYPKDVYSSGTYEVQVEILKWTIFSYWDIGSKRSYFDLTSLLNGALNMSQNNEIVKENYVSSASEVTHFIQFTAPDQEFLKNNATSVTTYWFVDCIYYGATSDTSFKYNYSATADKAHVEALVVAGFEPLPPPTTTPSPTTTTTTTNATVAPTTSKPTTITTTTKPTATSTTEKSSNNITALVQPHLKLGSNVSEIPILPFVCLNTSIIAPDPKKTYGYFSQEIEVKAPVSNIQLTGNNWLKHGDIMNLSVSCNGSSPFLYCFQFYKGLYNTTGNETCSNEILISECQVTVPRYFHNPGTYTVVFIIRNQVSRKVSTVGVNIYEVKKHAQLSVIVVPVACSLVAVILIVFGAAYYMQSKHRYTIEVANFDFAQAGDLEYMTFSQRLKDALNNAFVRTHDMTRDKICDDDNKSEKSTSSVSTASTDVPTSVSHM